MTTTIYRNDTTGYTVTLTDNGRGARVTDSKGFTFPMVGSDYPYAGLLAKSRAHLNGATEIPAAPVAQMTSPLAVTDQRASHLVNPGASLVMPSLPQARCLAWAQNCDPYHRVRRGRASVIGKTAPLDVLIAMSRRGWVTLDHDIMPTSGCITRAGSNALAAYVAKNGPVQ
jgi:hypothetical protein